jgi:mono/diheme cytochrome c family protein
VAERRRVLVFLLASAIVGAGCSVPEPLDDTGTTTDNQRRERLREQLRSSLGARYDAPLPLGTDEEIGHGSKLYEVLCRACHGSTGKGNGKSARSLPIQPRDLSDPSTASFFSDQAKLRIVTEGIDGTPMIGWSLMLEEQERIAVLHFMNTLIRESPSP